jgi:LPS export ABC transporter protein LptC
VKIFIVFRLVLALQIFGLSSAGMTRTSLCHRLLQAAFTGSCLLFSGCENSQQSLDEWQKQKVLVEEATNIQTLFSQKGQMRSRLTAPLMIRHSSDTVYVEFPKSLRMAFFDSLTQEQSVLKAGYGKYFESLNKAYLRDSVVVASTSGDTLWTSELWWDQSTQLFTTSKRVKIHRKGDRIYGGKGLQAKQDLTDIIIYKVEQPSRVNVPDSMAGQ